MERPAPVDPAPSESPSGGSTAGNDLRDVLGALPLLARAGWFGLGALSATAITLLVLLGPWLKQRERQSALPYEGLPLATNEGVCQEYVALATLKTSRLDAISVVQQLLPRLPSAVRPENVRTVRAFSPGDTWTVAVDAQAGAGDMAQAGRIAEIMNSIPGTGVHFEPIFYSSRKLYDTAGVLCMPRSTGGWLGHAGTPLAR